MNQYVIIPGCSDLNRGDQALVWETKRLAQDAGFEGEFYMTSEKNEPTSQSQVQGLKIVLPILEHPSRKFKNKENIKYTKTLKIKWGMVSILDLVWSFFLFFKPTRVFLKTFMDQEKKRSLEIFENSDAIFMKGGGLLQTYGGLSSTYSMYFWVYPILLAHRLHKPVYVMPNSFGPFEGPLVKYIARKALSKCKLVTSRETLSQNMVKEQLGMEIQNFPDLAFTLPYSKLEREELFSKYDIPLNQKLVAITMRPYRFPLSKNPEKAYDTFKKEMADFLKWLYQEGYMPVIVEHTLAINAHENDGACIQDVCKMLDSKTYRIVRENSFNCMDLKCLYGYCDYIVGTRFHSVIFSLGRKIPGIAIAYTGNKSQGIMQDIGLGEYVLQIEEVRAQRLKTLFTHLVENKQSVQQKIQNYLDLVQKERNRLIQQCK